MDLNIPILTTNYDALLEKATTYSPVTWREQSKYERVIQGETKGILHLHGFYEDPESVVLGIDSYERLLQDGFAQSMQHSLRALNTLLFIGFGQGLEDPNFSALLSWARRIFTDGAFRHYRLALEADVSAIQKEHRPEDKVYVLAYGKNYSELAGFLGELVSPEPTNPSAVPVLKKGSRSTAGTSTPSVTSHVTATADALLDEYLEAAKQTHGHISFGESTYYDDLPDVEIEKSYVESHVSTKQILPDRSETEWPQCWSIAEVLKQHHRIVFLGDPGYGKSTLVKSITNKLCNERQIIPLPMIVRELQLKADVTWQSLLKSFLAHPLGKHLSESVVKSLLCSGQAVVLLDGLDEISNIVVRKKLREAVHDGMREYDKSRWILTSRIVGYSDVPFHFVSYDVVLPTPVRKSRRKLAPKGLEYASVYYLAPFTRKQIFQFSTNWYRQHEKVTTVANERSEEFTTAIASNIGTQKLARVPYLLTLMALIHRKSATLPHGRAELYDRIANAYLESIDVRRKLDQSPYSLIQKKRWLAEVAFQMQLKRTKNRSKDEDREPEILAREEEVLAWLKNVMSDLGAVSVDVDAENVLNYFAVRSGLLSPRGQGLFAFMHLSLQEFFAANYLESRLTASRFAKTKRRIPSNKQLWEWASREEWVEAYILTFELLAKREPEDTEYFFNHVIDARAEATKGDSPLASLLIELVSDPYVALKPTSRSIGRTLCWQWQLTAGKRSASNLGPFLEPSKVVQKLVTEAKGSLEDAWQMANLTSDSMREFAVNMPLGGCTEIIDISALSELTGLNNVNLSDCRKLVDVSALSTLAKLNTLSLGGCSEIADLSSLSQLKHLKAVEMAGVKDVDHIAGSLVQLKSLITLSLPICASFDCLAFLPELPKLRVLRIEHLSVPVNFAYLSLCPNLKSLTIGGSSTSQDISLLVGCESIEDVHFHRFEKPLDLHPLAGWKSLKRLCTLGTEDVAIPPELFDLRSWAPSRKPRTMSAAVSRTKRKVGDG